MRTFRMPHRDACVIISFNAFAQNLAAYDQLAALRSWHEHLVPGGQLVFDVFSATPAMVEASVAEPVLELEPPHPETWLMLHLAGLARREITGGFDDRPVADHEDGHRRRRVQGRLRHPRSIRKRGFRGSCR